LPFVLVALHIFKGFTSRKQLLAAGGHFVTDVEACLSEAFDCIGYLHVQVWLDQAQRSDNTAQTSYEVSAGG